MGPSFSGSLAKFVCELEASQLNGHVIAALQRVLIDGIASMFAGLRESVMAPALRHVAQTAFSQDCTIVGCDQRATALGAALANGLLAHASDYDDSSWTMWGHPTAPILPAILASAELLGLSGQQLLVALAAAIEVEKALGLATQPEHYRRGWHPTATLGVFGATAGAGKNLGLNQDQMLAAFGIAASMSAGLRANTGTDTKPLHVAFAARNGLEAAMLAKSGVASSPDALDGRFGFLSLYAINEPERIRSAVGALGRPYEVIEPGLSPKLYPCCSDIHCAIDALLDLEAEHHFTPDSVIEIRCTVAPLAEPNVRQRNPRTPTEAKFSLSYCLAAALVHGKIGLPQFEPDAIENSAVRELMERIHVRADPGLVENGEVYSSPAVVEVLTGSGAKLRSAVSEMRGHPNRPLTIQDLVGKFEECSKRVLSHSKASALLAAIQRIEMLPDIRSLMSLTTP